MRVALVSCALSALPAAAQERGQGFVGDEHHFLTAQACATCHRAAPTARALWNQTGDDVSPFTTWSATMMANSFRDPYWRAQVSKEVAAAAPERRDEIEALCVRCHAPMAHHDALLARHEPPGLARAVHDPLAHDGVSCTVCHQAQASNLGSEDSFSGRLHITGDNKIFGPYPEPATEPMAMHTGYHVEYGPHVANAALCGSCHTLITSHVPGHGPFPEQTPFLEWRNSVFSDEDGRTPASRTCQQCHMPEQGDLKIARNPRGLDFNIKTRPEVRAHTFVGGNAFMLDLLAQNREALGAPASAEALARTARATRQQLAHSTARVAIEGTELRAGTLSFAVRVTNLCGHKLPTGYPARRAWLRVVVRAGNRAVFVSGEVDAQGRLMGVADERALPHFDAVSKPEEVVVYEAVPVDKNGRATTYLTQMVAMGKDTRLLPKGWRADGPEAERTAPKGLSADHDFVGGEDVVHYALPLVIESRTRVAVIVSLLYQSVPPAWVDPLRTVPTAEAKAFVAMYDAMAQEPETLALAVAIVE
jgi:hypothetical protein